MSFPFSDFNFLQEGLSVLKTRFYPAAGRLLISDGRICIKVFSKLVISFSGSKIPLNKNDLRMRSIYHWTPKRIKSHIVICYLSYALACFVRYSLKQANIKLSFERIREELSFVQSSIVRDTKTGRRFVLPAKVTATQKAIYGVFNKKLNQTVQFL